ncbi:hypothetical protein A2291_04215 [candidate division WOR-1 bacterium RIFOXYB2_FULL_42_35]|uniref:Glycosyltransferase 2-like domain-containing protein n=1 Tax=candidate division WOR-1 bacterium RIFOXYC2_FULL_41_25 TaxID=1802586 RepID=A0A1F4TMV4_UNCSA|nr:MAG: hypothetical protein A2247_01055 [candidate division WOR-1 bacterium RIFOXYA2_FULL_41_14]OGC24336.1 MAG: hypothetical protein A2291_04215 [candidate division WOR-1 bacterium RIFOXYB2_FULL_42_35]OGC34038.1 MAG: hypothetical protein A2462_01620 [candidate division WOR-1 bacterium RIFOXYC2_FULL_41_25]OGC42352.1 MAG: hypothetical protein A2548_07330 [candidate division WOR-1 bacterium RIFOXYD2_FULL_41_8]
MPKTYVIIPTYNEAENISKLLEQINSLNIPDLTPVVVDDNSPDETWRVAQEIPGTKVLRRMKGRGRGSAGIDGFKFALNEGADYIIEMDADLSHQPKYIPSMLKAMAEYDVVLGSRHVPGGKDIERSLIRQITTLFAQSYIKLMLGVKVKDPTSGFRCFKREVLENIGLDSMISTGQWIVSEVLYKVHLKGYKIGEIPIVFIDRTQGETKLNLKALFQSLYMVYKFRRTFR